VVSKFALACLAVLLHSMLARLSWEILLDQLVTMLEEVSLEVSNGFDNFFRSRQSGEEIGR
jgi:hypothetical protein